jgi:DNA-binding XRE family transcriptional regulator|tara:strand:- start:1541 stop:1831 length:291 start_codon:yes stop_codon:yes gene_type:complete
MPEELKPIDFSGVEALRKHMLLNTSQMSKFLGVSRVTYGGWVKGKPIRKGNNIKVRAALKKMFGAITAHEWPTPEAIAMVPAQRFNTLLELTKEEE